MSEENVDGTANNIPEGMNRVVVTLHRPEHKHELAQEMTSLGNVSEFVPSRVVEVANYKPDSLRNIDFYLTADEWLVLDQDPRVRATRWGSKAENNLEIKIDALASPQVAASVGYLYSNAEVNRGLASCYSDYNPFADLNNTAAPFGAINNWRRPYVLERPGEGVDVLIMDTGIEDTHPEWNDENGNSRLVRVNWLSGGVILFANSSANLRQVEFQHTRSYIYGNTLTPNTYVAINGFTNPPDYISGNVRVVSSVVKDNAFSNTVVEYDSPRSGPIQYANSILGPATASVYDFTVLPTGANIPTTFGNAFYFDVSGHGTHVAAIAAGRTYGHAPYANIYSLKVTRTPSTPGAPADSVVLSTSEAFNRIRAWHLLKPLQPNGYRRPTIVNCSYGFALSGESVISGSIGNISWRGEANVGSGLSWSPNNATTVFMPRGLVSSSTAWAAGLDTIPASVESVNSDIEDAIAAGVIVIAAAGNNCFKIDVPGGADYDNFIALRSRVQISEGYYVNIGQRFYYHRGSTPGAANGVMNIGNMDSQNYYTYGGGARECRDILSSNGPGITVWAPGRDVASACSNGCYGTTGSPKGYQYPWDTRYKMTKYGGTSQASPQAVGVAAVALGLFPWFTAKDTADFLMNSAIREDGGLATNSSPVIKNIEKNAPTAGNTRLYMTFINSYSAGEYVPPTASQVRISGVTGTSPDWDTLNGNFYCRQWSANSFYIFHDAALTQPVNSASFTGSYTANSGQAIGLWRVANLRIPLYPYAPWNEQQQGYSRQFGLNGANQYYLRNPFGTVELSNFQLGISNNSPGETDIYGLI